MEKTYIYHGKKIAFNDNGTGNTVVLLHGFTESKSIWENYSKHLSKFFRVVCIDLPGHGKSDSIAEVHTMPQMADVVVSLLSEIKVPKYVVIGHSMGGYVTLSIAERYSEQIEGFGLFHSSALADTDEGKANRKRAIEIIKKGHKNFLSAFIPELFAPHNKNRFKNEIDKLISESYQMSSEAVVAAQEGMLLRENKYSVLQNAKVPVMFISGKLDTRIPFEKISEQIVLPAESHVLLIHDIAHMGYIEAEEKTLKFTESFLTSVFTEK